ncbi:hypothetical protein [Kiritimatiella glycovorans]|uniref:Lipid A core-O-antigen ligase n=1 Tax=Kiritimatiella glycovorans TaxID=1307763 RepID=A0A0G3EJB4_9BACT|nr:hypothetical protein [Kiritimatiella glycovorans]AKJ65527.1 hypothetical protein L21SP4_02300 [Kiritimatiella glycovorans]
MNYKLREALFLFSFILLGLVMFAVTKSILVWAFLAVAMMGIIMVGNPKVLLLIYWIYLNVYPLAKEVVPSIITQWSDEAFIVMMLGILAMRYIRFREVPPGCRTMTRVLWFLIGLVFISAILTGGVNFYLVMYYSHYFRCFLVFYFALIVLPRENYRFYYKMLIVGAFIHIILNAGWYVGANPLPNPKLGGPDFARGGVEGCNYVAYFTVGVLGVLFGLIVFGSGRKKLAAAALFGIMLIQLYFTFTIHAYFIFAAAMAALMIITRNYRALIAGAVLLTMLYTGFSAIQAQQSEVGKMVSSKNLEKRWERFMQGTKLESYRRSIVELPRDAKYFWLVGAGPGKAGSVIGRETRQPIAEKYYNWMRKAVSGQRISLGGSITTGIVTALLTIWSEMGPIGFVLYWWLWGYALYRIYNQYSRNMYCDPYQNALALGFVAYAVTMFGIFALAPLLHVAFLTNAFWLWAAILWVPGLSCSGKPAKNTAPHYA